MGLNPVPEFAMQVTQSLPLLSGVSSALTLQLATKKPTSTLVIVDPCVEDSVALMQAIDENAEVILLDSKRNGVEQITEILIGRCQIRQLQLISLGCPGKIRLGSDWLDQSMLSKYQPELQSWQQAFTPETEMLLYDCTVAWGTEGMAFVGQLSQLTGTLLAVSYSPYLDELA